MDKIVWAEGVFLGQQHFQVWDRQLERSQYLRQCLLNPFCWGVVSMVIDRELLELGRFELREVTVLFQDGRMAAFQDDGDSPLSCELQGPGGDALGVYLAVPANHQVHGISGYPKQSGVCGWTANYRELEDCFDHGRTREVLMARPNLFLTTNSQALGECLNIKVAEVTHDGDQRYRLLDSYIPPLCRLGASSVLGRQLQRIVESLNARRKQIENARQGCDGGASGFARSDPNHHTLLQSLNGILPRLRHLATHADLHPELLYRELCQAAGALCAYHTKATIDSIPAYTHDDLAGVFGAFDRLLSLLLELDTAAEPTALVLHKEADHLLCCSEIPARLFSDATFFIEVLFEADDPNWITDFARQAKVAARNAIETSVASALPGVRLIHTQRPPAKLATRSGCEYFRLEARGDFWSGIIDDGSLAIYLPHPFSTSDIKLVTVEE